MKRTFSLLLSALMSFSACACQGEGIPDQVGDKSSTVMPGDDRASENTDPVTEPFSIHYTGATHIRTYFVEEYVDQISAKIKAFFTERLLEGLDGHNAV